MNDKDRPVLFVSVSRELNAERKEAVERMEPRSIPVLNISRSVGVAGDFDYLSVHVHTFALIQGWGVIERLFTRQPRRHLTGNQG